MSRNIPKILKILKKHDGLIFGTQSGSWFPVGTELPEPPVESELHSLSVGIFNCTCNTYTIRNMIQQGLLEPAEVEGVYKMTDLAEDIIAGRGV